MPNISQLGRAALVLLALGAGGCGNVFRESDPPQITEFAANGRSVVAPQVGTATFGSVAAPLQVGTGSAVVVVCQASDPDRDALFYTWGGPGVTQPTDVPFLLKWVAPSTEGTCCLTCTVSDGRGKSATRSVYVQVTDSKLNHTPLASFTPAGFVSGPGEPQALTCTASDPDGGDCLTYTFFATAGAIQVDGTSPSKATYTPPAQPGSQTIYCIVSDGKGGYGLATAAATVRLQ